MRVRIAYTVDVADDFRRAINVYYGEEGLADREQVRRWFMDHGSAMDDDLAENAND